MPARPQPPLPPLPRRFFALPLPWLRVPKNFLLRFQSLAIQITLCLQSCHALYELGHFQILAKRPEGLLRLSCAEAALGGREAEYRRHAKRRELLACQEFVEYFLYFLGLFC